MRRSAVVLSLALLVVGCVVGGAEPEQSALETPAFEPDPTPQPSETPAGGDEQDPDDSAPSAGTDDGSGAPSAPQEDAADDPPGDHPASDPGEQEPSDRSERAVSDEAPPLLRARVTDSRGDTRSARVTSTPRYADLVGAVLERRPDRGYRLEIELDGGAPRGARDGDHTMNVATYYDVTGDGHVDVEVWANLADGGWDTSHYDNRAGEAAFSDDDEVTVAVEDDVLVLRFPLGLLDGAARFRWAVASEWGRYEELGTPLSARDEMPDDGRPARFPE